MKTQILIFLSLVIFSFCVEEADFPIENNITVLTEATFDKAISLYDHILVMFYAPWCGHCKKFKPELEKAAEVLRKENLIVAKVDATVEKKLAEKYKVKGYPTVKFFIKGEPIDYTAGRKEKEVIDWVRKKSGPPTTPIKSIEELEKLQKNKDVIVVYFGTDAEELKIFTKAALVHEDFPFFTVECPKIAEKLNAKQKSVVIFKQFDEKRNDLLEIQETPLNEFLEKNTVRRIGTFDEKTVDIIFGKYKPCIAYFGEKGAKWDEVKIEMEKVYEKYNSKLKFIMSEVNKGMEKRVADYIGVKKDGLPKVLILDTKKELDKYVMEGEITEKNLIQFIEDWENKKLKKFLKSEEIPKDNNGDIFVVVGKSFQKDVIENDNDVLLVFYAPWCGHCKRLLPEYEKAAKKIKAANPKIILAKMDATENEVEGVHITGFPTIKFYPGDKKNEKPKDYSGERNADSIIKYLEKNAYNKLVLEEEKAKTSDL